MCVCDLAVILGAATDDVDSKGNGGASADVASYDRDRMPGTTLRWRSTQMADARYTFETRGGRHTCRIFDCADYTAKIVRVQSETEV